MAGSAIFVRQSKPDEVNVAVGKRALGRVRSSCVCKSSYVKPGGEVVVGGTVITDSARLFRHPSIASKSEM